MRISTSLVLGAGIVVTAVPMARATLLAQEDFSGYTAGQPLTGQGSAGNGFSDGWRNAAFAFFDVNGLTVKANPVVDSGIVSSGQSASGGFTRLERDLSPATVTATEAQTTYISFVGGAFAESQVDLSFKSDNDGDHVAEFAWTNSSAYNSTTGTGTGSTVLVDNPNATSTQTTMSGTTVTTTEDISTTLGDTSSQYPTESPDLYVIKFDPLAKTVQYFLFDNGERPASLADASLTSPVFTINALHDVYAAGVDTGVVGYDRVGIFTVEGPSTTGISNIRIGTTFADVAPVTPNVPEPASLSLLALGSLGIMRRRRA